MIDTILKYFPELTDCQRNQLQTMMQLYPEWNARINVISRKDIDNLEINHLLHSLSIAKFIQFTPGTKILDLGCGGGLPGLPLAVMFPECKFHLVDRVGKKIRVATEIAEACCLDNVTCQHGDSSECQRNAYDFVVSRAVMNLPELVKISRPHISHTNTNAYPNGLITLKGGELTEELARYKDKTLLQELHTWFPDIPFFATKLLTYTPL